MTKGDRRGGSRYNNSMRMRTRGRKRSQTGWPLRRMSYTSAQRPNTAAFSCAARSRNHTFTTVAASGVRA